MTKAELSETLISWNAQAVEVATALLKRAQAIGIEVAALGDNMWHILIEGGERKRLLEECRVLRGDVSALDDEIIHYWRIEPVPSQNLDPKWFETQMSSRATVRDAIMRYVDDAEDAMHEIVLRAIARTTLWIATLTLVFAAIAAVPEMRNWFRT